MSPLLVALLFVYLVPLFVASWRTSLFGLSCQGFLMAWLAYRMGPQPHTVNDWLTLGDLVVVRAVGAPVALYAVLRAHGTPARNDVISPNLFSWTLALGIVLVAFELSGLLVAEHGEQQTLTAVATAGVLLGFLVLATRGGAFSQMIGALRIEYAIALFELGGDHHDEPLGVHLGQIAIVAITIVLYRWYLGALRATPGDAGEEPFSGPTL